MAWEPISVSTLFYGKATLVATLAEHYSHAVGCEGQKPHWVIEINIVVRCLSRPCRSWLTWSCMMPVASGTRSCWSTISGRASTTPTSKTPTGTTGRLSTGHAQKVCSSSGVRGTWLKRLQNAAVGLYREKEPGTSSDVTENVCECIH